MSARVFLYVQHLLGIGHLRRAATIARALAASGFDVLLVSGGAPLADMALDGVRFYQLPPLRAANEGLKELARIDGGPVDAAFRESRADQLVGLLRRESPAVVITEQFPFGRTQLRFELVPLIAAAKVLRPRPLIVSSLRDVVRRSASPQRVAESVAAFVDFDALLIHADPALVRLEESFPAWASVAPRASYTGYVMETHPARPTEDTAGSGEVVVSAGGGAIGGPLLKAAIGARRLGALADRTWRLLIGPNLPAVDRAEIAALRDGRLIVEPVRADFPTLLRNATLSISQAGYNTVIETVRHGDRAVLVPFGTARETEQADRANALAERGMVAVVPPGTLSSRTLAAAVEQALVGPSIRSFPAIDTGGGAATARALTRMLAARGDG